MGFNDSHWFWEPRRNYELEHGMKSDVFDLVLIVPC